jgi:hypothetical protein
MVPPLAVDPCDRDGRCRGGGAIEFERPRPQEEAVLPPTDALIADQDAAARTARLHHDRERRRGLSTAGIIEVVAVERRTVIAGEAETIRMVLRHDAGGAATDRVLRVVFHAAIQRVRRASMIYPRSASGMIRCRVFCHGGRSMNGGVDDAEITVRAVDAHTGCAL